jgi:hypothetical protein
MNDETRLLLGSLSNDLFRVATLAQRGSVTGAGRFLQEAKRWAGPLKSMPVKAYIKKIAAEIEAADGEIDMALAEKYLMYGILVQNYAKRI